MAPVEEIPTAEESDGALSLEQQEPPQDHDLPGALDSAEGAWQAQNLSGIWEVGGEGEPLELRHVPGLAALWSVQHDCERQRESLWCSLRRGPASEQGALSWRLTAKFGLAEIAHGEGTLVHNGSAEIKWNNGSHWRRRQSEAHLRWSEVPASTVRAVMCHVWSRPWLSHCWLLLCSAVLWCVILFILAQMLCLVVTIVPIHVHNDRRLHAWVSWLLLIAIFSLCLSCNLDAVAARLRAVRNNNWGRVAAAFCFMVSLTSTAIIGGPALFGAEQAPEEVRALVGACVLFLSLVTVCRSRQRVAQSAAIALEDPLTWTGVKVVSDEVRREVMEAFAVDKALSLHYKFDLHIDEVYEVEAPSSERRFVMCEESLRSPINGASTPHLGTRRLYHGAPTIAVKSIAGQGFRLPNRCCRASMFGRGIYFAEVPQKSWTFSSDCQFVLVCDVALGHAKHMKESEPSLSLPLLRTQSLRGTRYDSVMGCDREQGGVLNVKEYVVYREEQAVPRYLLKLRETSMEPPSLESLQYAAMPAESLQYAAMPAAMP